MPVPSRRSRRPPIQCSSSAYGCVEAFTLTTARLRDPARMGALAGAAFLDRLKQPRALVGVEVIVSGAELTPGFRARGPLATS